MTFGSHSGLYREMHAPCRRTIVCDVGALVAPDAGTIDVLARLQLAAHRVGKEIRLRHASSELRELLAFTGLEDALPLELEGQPEERE
jgi:ABC-type transporter Mla MlaB component